MIPMLPIVREALLHQKQIQDQEVIGGIEDIHGCSNFVFTTIHGKPFTAPVLNSALKTMVGKHNEKFGGTRVMLPHIHCHTLRHTFATRMYESGVSTKAMQTVLGHSTISVTMDIYTDASDEFVEEQLRNSLSKYSVTA